MGNEQRSWLGEREGHWTGPRCSLRSDTIITVTDRIVGPGHFLDGKLSEGKGSWVSFSCLLYDYHSAVYILTSKYLSEGTLSCNYQKLTLTHLGWGGEGEVMSRKYSAAPYKGQKPGSPLFSQPPQDSMASYLPFIVLSLFPWTRMATPGQLYIISQAFNRDCKCSGFQNLAMHQNHLESF